LAATKQIFIPPELPGFPSRKAHIPAKLVLNPSASNHSPVYAYGDNGSCMERAQQQAFQDWVNAVEGTSFEKLPPPETAGNLWIVARKLQSARAWPCINIMYVMLAIQMNNDIRSMYI
jgi:hypothetical protein